MTLLSEASFLVTPNGYKASKLYAAIPTNGNGDMTVTRATTATRVNENDLVSSVASNIPRIDYTGGGCPSILLEPLRTNLLLDSDTVETQTITTTAVANTLSFYGTGTITLSGTFAGHLEGTGETNRVSLTFTPTDGSLVLTVSDYCVNGQLEVGSYATSYIPTTTSTVTRNADVLSRDNIYTNNLIVAGGGTWFVHLINNTAFTADSNLGAIYLDTSSVGYTNGLMLRKETAGRIRLQTYVSTTGSFIYTTTTDTVKILFKWNGANADVFVNGTKAVSATPFTPTTMQYLATNNVIYALIKETMLFPKQLTDAQCIALTTL